MIHNVQGRLVTQLHPGVGVLYNNDRMSLIIGSRVSDKETTLTWLTHFGKNLELHTLTYPNSFKIPKLFVLLGFSNE